MCSTIAIDQVRKSSNISQQLASQDIEDVLGDAAYVELVNQCYGIEGKNTIAPPETKDGEVPGRIVKFVEEWFRTMTPEVPNLNHTEPADLMIRQGLDLTLPDLHTALDRFESLFSDLNTMLDRDDGESTMTIPEIVIPGRNRPKREKANHRWHEN